MRSVVVISHTYVEPENRGKLRALAQFSQVTAVVPNRWRERALRHRWRLHQKAIDGGVRIVPTRWWGPAHPALGMMLVPEATEAGRPSLLQIEEEPWTPTALMAIQRSSTPTILFTWENRLRKFPPPWSWARRAVFARLNGLIAGSQAAAEVAQSLGYAGPLAVIPQLGVDLPKQEPARSSERPRATFVGRLVKEKGVDVLLLAVRQVAEPCTVSIVGDGPERQRLEALSQALGIRDRVTFHGPLPRHEVAAVWRESDICVLPSRSTGSWSEQLGHVLLEAMARGVLVIGTASGAIPEVIGDAGCLFPENDVSALAAILSECITRPERCRELAAKGRRRVADHFTNHRIAERTLDFHDAVLSAT